METIGIIISCIIILVLGLAFVAMWKSNNDPMSDYELYGMDGDEYTDNRYGIIKD